MTVKVFLTAVSLKDTRLTTAKAAEGPTCSALKRAKKGKGNRQPASGRPILVPFGDSRALSKNISRK
jgi:hypothetical protein